MHTSFRWGWRHWVLASSLLVATGCGSSEEPAATEAPAATKAAANAAPKAQASAAPKGPQIRFAKPDETVREFLTALKSGDQARSTSMLSEKAQAEMARTQAAIRPPGSPSATFHVTEVEYVGKDQSAAHVLSTWNDAEDESDSTHEIVWILRKEPKGWAIAGMATKVFDDQDPLVLNFEDPVDAQRKRTQVDAEIARRQQSETETK